MYKLLIIFLPLLLLIRSDNRAQIMPQASGKSTKAQTADRVEKLIARIDSLRCAHESKKDSLDGERKIVLGKGH